MYKNKPFDQQKTSKTAEYSIYQCASDSSDENKAFAKEMHEKNKKLHKLWPSR